MLTLGIGKTFAGPTADTALLSLEQQCLEEPTQRPPNWNIKSQLFRDDQISDSEETQDFSEVAEIFERFGSVEPSTTSTKDSTMILRPPDATVKETLIGSIPKPAVSLIAKQSFSLEEYLVQSADEISPALQTYERSLVESFISGIQSKGQQATLCARLDERGWQWKIACEEVKKMIEEDVVKRKLSQANARPRANDGRFVRKRKRRN